MLTLSESEVRKRMEALSSSAEVAKLMLGISQIETIPKNKILIPAGKKCRYGYIVLEGAFVMQYVGNNGIPRTVSFHLNNHHPYMAPAEAFFMGTLSEYQVKAVDESIVLRISSTDIERLKATHVEFDKSHSETLLEYLIKQDKMKTKLVMLKPEELYHDMIKNEPYIIESFPSKYIAEYIGISREWLSKLRSRKQ